MGQVLAPMVRSTMGRQYSSSTSAHSRHCFFLCVGEGGGAGVGPSDGVFVGLNPARPTMCVLHTWSVSFKTHRQVSDDAEHQLGRVQPLVGGGGPQHAQEQVHGDGHAAVIVFEFGGDRVRSVRGCGRMLPELLLC